MRKIIALAKKHILQKQLFLHSGNSYYILLFIKKDGSF